MSFISEISSTTQSDVANSGEDSSEDDSFDDMYEAAEIGVPFGITIVVIIVLCVTVAYTKYRKRRLMHHARTGMPHISGGVPMSAGAYLNQAFQTSNVSNTQSVPQNNQYSSPPPMYSVQSTTPVCHFPNVQGPVIGPTLPAYQADYDGISDQPPKYDDVIKESSASDGTVLSDVVTTVGQENQSFSIENETGNSANEDISSTHQREHVIKDTDSTIFQQTTITEPVSENITINDSSNTQLTPSDRHNEGNDVS